MCEASYTVGPQLYQFTLLPFFGTNTSFFLVKLLNSFKRHVSATSPLDQAGCVRFVEAMTGTCPIRRNMIIARTAVGKYLSESRHPHVLSAHVLVRNSLVVLDEQISGGTIDADRKMSLPAQYRTC
jgi:hypothetical protein